MQGYHWVLQIDGSLELSFLTNTNCRWVRFTYLWCINSRYVL